MEQKMSTGAKGKGSIRYTTDNFPIKNNYYYVISFRKFINLVLYPVFFVNKVAAKRAITSNIAPTHRGKYQVIRGLKLRQYTLLYNIGIGKMAKFTKYEFPPHVRTAQDKKTFRTVMRRRLRRMGIFTKLNPKKTIMGAITQNRLIPNKQKVANCPNTLARAFRLERKPKSHYYIIVDKKPSGDKATLIEVDTILYNKKTGEIKDKIIKINTKDIVIPYLISQVLAFSKDNYEELKTHIARRGINLFG